MNSVGFWLLGLWIGAGSAIECLLLWRQWRFLGAQPPQADASAISYGRRRALTVWSRLIEALLRLALWCSVGAVLWPVLTNRADEAPGVAASVWLLTLFVLIDSLLRQPWIWWRHALLGQPGALTRAAFWRRALRESALSVARYTGWALAASILVWVLWGGPMLLAWPLIAVLIAIAWWLDYALLPQLRTPIVGRLEPLANRALYERLQQMTAASGQTLTSIWQVSPRGRASVPAACFIGVGRRRRIVVSQALLETLAPAEVEAVVAHELAHYRCGHVYRYYGGLGAWFVVGISVVGLWLDHWLALSPLGLLAVMYLLFDVCYWPWVPWSSGLRRGYEFEADAFAARHATRDGLIRALEKLLAANPNRAGMDRWYAWFYASHPPGAARLARLRALDEHSQD